MNFRSSLLATLILPLPLAAQIRASEVGTMSQMIDGTRISVEYSRPRARGRDKLFGTPAVHWGETWTPGANWATTLEVSRNVKLNGHQVAKGKYSVWMVVKEHDDWTVVLDPKARRFHMNPPDSGAAQIRFPARVETVPFTDVLTWSMPELRMNGGTLAMQWERTRVPINVEVEPSLASSLPASEAEPYIGAYTFTAQDSTGKPGKVSVFTVTHEAGILKGRWTPDDAYMKKFAMIRIAPDWFAPGIYDKNGDIYEVLKPDIVIEFTRANGRAASFTMRYEDDKVWGIGTRRP